MMRPPSPRSIIRLPTAWLMRNVPCTLTRITKSNFSSGISSAGAPHVAPLLLTRMSMSPKVSSVCLENSASSSKYETSRSSTPFLWAVMIFLASTLLVILVPALAGLAPQLAILVLLGDRLLRLHALIAGFLVALHPDVVVDVYAGEVHELERTHRVAQGRLARRVYVLEGAHAVLVEVHGLVH